MVFTFFAQSTDAAVMSPMTFANMLLMVTCIAAGISDFCHGGPILAAIALGYQSVKQTLKALKWFVEDHLGSIRDNMPFTHNFIANYSAYHATLLANCGPNCHGCTVCKDLEHDVVTLIDAIYDLNQLVRAPFQTRSSITATQLKQAYFLLMLQFACLAASHVYSKPAVTYFSTLKELNVDTFGSNLTILFLTVALSFWTHLSLTVASVLHLARTQLIIISCQAQTQIQQGNRFHRILQNVRFTFRRRLLRARSQYAAAMHEIIENRDSQHRTRMQYLVDRFDALVFDLKKQLGDALRLAEFRGDHAKLLERIIEGTVDCEEFDVQVRLAMGCEAFYYIESSKSDGSEPAAEASDD